VGDAFRVASGNNKADVLRNLIRSTKDKLTTYPELRVSVVGDISTAKGTQDDPLTRSEVVGGLKEEIAAPILGRLLKLSVVRGSDVVTVLPADLT
jgi:hypothetical protein